MQLKKSLSWIFFLLSLAFAWASSVPAAQTPLSAPSDILIVWGTITNSHGKPIKEVRVDLHVNGRKIELEEEIVSSNKGEYQAKLVLPRGTLPRAEVSLETSRPSYAPSGMILLEHLVEEKTDEQGNRFYLARQDIQLARAVTPAFWVATLVLTGVYVFIAFGLMHRTLAVFLGAALLLTITYTVGTFNPDFIVLTYEDAVQAIDMNVILLLMAMMIIVGTLKRTGVFQWMAYKSFQLARGNVFALSGILMVVTAVISAFLDNVTTMLLIIPVTIEIAETLKINPVTLFMPEVFASNVGGTATLIGDPPNIAIGSYVKLSFLDFVQNLTLICALCLVFTVVYFLYHYRNDYLQAKVGDVQELLQHLREKYRITDRTLLIQGGILLGVTILLFIFHEALHMELSIAAMFGAAVLLVVSRTDIVEILEHEIEWPTLIFFMMLFIVVAGAEETGLIQALADWMSSVSQGSLVLAILMVLWVSAVAAAIVGNVPFTVTMLPVVAYLTTTTPGAEGGILWWSLALGACLGGNGTMIGAAANVITVGMAERVGYPISFLHYFKVVFVPTLITVLLSSAWLLFAAK
ncbi:MAG: ArsB/NhaD family transporter [Syntrophobacteraceae bacterium]|nr:ArsB/NhaD family transporter [Syntrophobacteraceae bacterium]